MKRRDFIKILSASMAAVASGCRRPDEKFVPLVNPVEYMVPGNEDYFSTVLMSGYAAHGLVVRLREGKPVKIDGNPDHPVTLGGSSPVLQAMVYSLYDPDRFRKPRCEDKPASLDEALSQVLKMVSGSADRGKKTAIMIGPHCSPAFNSLIDLIEKKIPYINFFVYDSLGRGYSAQKANAMLFGIKGQPVPDLSKAELVVTLNSDILGANDNAVYFNRAYSIGRKSGARFRLVAIESGYTLTGANADERIALSPPEFDSFACSLLQYIESRQSPASNNNSNDSGKYYNHVPGIGDELLKSGGKAVVIAGDACPVTVHILVNRINEALGSLGHGKAFDPFVTLPVSSGRLLSEGNIDSVFQGGHYDNIIFAGVNPFYSSRSRIKELTKSITNKIAFSLYPDETSAECTVSIPTAHFLECWGDAAFFDGTVSIQQPVIAPLNDSSASVQDLLMRLSAGLIDNIFAGASSYYEFLKGTHNKYASDRMAWESILRKGFYYLDNKTVTPLIKKINSVNVPVIQKDNYQGLLLTARPSVYLGDGSNANNAWLQELPHPITKTMWGNVASISPRSAGNYNLGEGDIIEIISVNGKISLPVHIQPGLADNVISSELGYGRTSGGHFARGLGGNVFDLLNLNHSPDQAVYSIPVEIKKTVRNQQIAKSQKHDFTEGRNIIKGFGHDDQIIRSDSPAGKEHSQSAPILKDKNSISIYPGYKYLGHRWGMAIDLDLCSGCNACVIACQAENNIAVVGRSDAANGRLLHWLRIDRYYNSDGSQAKVIFQPMLCQHCQQAPCEPVCPVSASSHSPEGINETTYNRCVGTRFCMANCPYKVRRFNFRDYSDNIRQPQNYALNPSVTVRMRGVVEKCTFCIQRINAARFRAKDEGRNRLADGECRTACQQACPTGAIVFGNLNDPESEVSRLSKAPRAFITLEELGTRPSVTYLSRRRSVK